MRGLRVRVTLLVASALLVSGVLAGPVAADSSTTTSLAVQQANPTAGGQFCLDATVTVTGTGSSVPVGFVAFYETTSGSDMLLGYGGWEAGLLSEALYCLPSGGVLGSHDFRADYDPYGSNNDPSSDTLEDVVVGKAPVIVHLDLWPASTVELGSTFEASMTTSADVTNETGSISLFRNGSATPLCTKPMGTVDGTSCVVQAPAVGANTFVAKFTGTTSVEAGDSETRSLQILPNTVHASGVGVQYTTFYPINDGYEDTVAIKGARTEPIGVTIKIYTPGGTLIKTQAIATGSGAYSYAWNGRTSSGTVRASGKYRITQSLKDVLGATKTYTNYVTLSKKKLHTYTKTITKKGSTVAAKGKNGTGSVTLTTSTGKALLKSGSDGWGGVGYDFSLPTATVYKSIKFKVQSKSPVAPWNVIGMQNFSTCAYTSSGTWHEECFDRWTSIGNGGNSAAYFTSTGSITTNRSGKHVRGMVSVPGGTVTVYKAQIVVVYGVLQ